jgi:hypothetical protein
MSQLLCLDCWAFFPSMFNFAVFSFVTWTLAPALAEWAFTWKEYCRLMSN